MRWRAQIDPHLFCSCHFAFVWTHGPPSSPSSSSSSLLSPPPLPLLPASISLCRQPGSVTPTVPIRSHYTWPGCAVCWWRPNKNRNSAVKRTQNVKKKYRPHLYSQHLIFVAARPALKKHGTLCNLEAQACNAWRKH